MAETTRPPLDTPEVVEAAADVMAGFLILRREFLINGQHYKPDEFESTVAKLCELANERDQRLEALSLPAKGRAIHIARQDFVIHKQATSVFPSPEL